LLFNFSNTFYLTGSNLFKGIDYF